MVDEAGATAVSGVESCEPSRGSEVNCLDVGESSDQRNLSADESGISSVNGAAKDCPQLSRPHDNSKVLRSTSHSVHETATQASSKI